MDKINVLWIEDNPVQEALYVRDLIKRDPELAKEFDKEIYDFRIPMIHFLESEYKDYFKYFNLQVLQHPEEIKDFISMSITLEDSKGKQAFMEMGEVLPEIIVFDYLLSERITINQAGDKVGSMSYHPKIQPIREYINPNYKFKSIFKKLFEDKEFLLEQASSENYSENDLLRSVAKLRDGDEISQKDLDNLKDDEFGLFAGIEILRLFREHAIIALPATQHKKETERLSLQAKYFQWLNEYDLNVDFDREGRGQKDWDTNLKGAVIALRSRIRSYISLGTIQPNLTQLKELSSGTLPAFGNDDKRIFSFTSVYGTRHLPLDGLFIDIGVTERDKAIAKWAGVLIDAWSSRTGYKFEEYEKASEISKNLIRAYRSGNVEKRHTLSELITKEVNGNLKSVAEKAQLMELMHYFGIDNTNIDGVKNRKNAKGKSKYNKIKNHITDIATETTGLREGIIKLVIYFADIRLHLLYQNFMKKAYKNEGYKGDFSNYLYTKPKFEFLEAVLFPVPESPLVLPYHYNFLVDSDPSEEKHLKDNWNSFFNLVRSRDMPYGEMITSAEKSICNNFAISVGLESVNYPVWLNK